MELRWIRQRIRAGDYEFSAHADDERQAEKIPIAEVEVALLNGEILENYPPIPVDRVVSCSDMRRPVIRFMRYAGRPFLKGCESSLSIFLLYQSGSIRGNVEEYYETV